MVGHLSVVSRARKKAWQKDAKVKRFEQSPGELGWTIRRSGRRIGRGATVGGASTVGVGANRDLERQLGQAARAAAAALAG
jgi:hypothetical protein